MVCKLAAPSARQLVGGTRQRYKLHGFDLDLTYVLDRIIAMGLPSTNIESIYRNPVDEVSRFFNDMHADHYLIINLCSERTYPTKPFHDRVIRIPFDGTPTTHTTSPLTMHTMQLYRISHLVNSSPPHALCVRVLVRVQITIRRRCRRCCTSASSWRASSRSTRTTSSPYIARAERAGTTTIVLDEACCVHIVLTMLVVVYACVAGRVR